MHLKPIGLKRFVVLFISFFAVAHGQTFDLHLPANSIGGTRVVSIGLLAPCGKFDDFVTPCIHIGAKRIRSQFEVRSRWPDGSFRWLRLIFPVRLSPGAARRIGVSAVGIKGSPQFPNSPLKILPQDGGFHCSNGLISFDITLDPSCVLKNMKHVRKAHHSIDAITIGHGIDEAKIVLQEAGPYRVLFEIRGQLRSDPKSPAIEFTRRVSLAVDQAEIEVESWFKPNLSDLPRGGLDLRFRLSQPATRFRTHQRAERISSRSFPLRLLATKDGHEVLSHARDSFDSYFQQFCLLGGFGSVAIRLHALQELRPSVLELTTEKEGLISLVSSQYRWHQGVQPGRRLNIALWPNHKKRRLISFHHPQVQPRKRADLPFPDFASLPSVIKLKDVTKPLIEILDLELDSTRASERGYFWLGEENYGDWRWNRTDAGNLEYDSAAGLRAAASFLEDPTLLARARAAIRHLYQRDLASFGLPLMHGAYHRQGGFESGHMWLAGAMNESILSGDPFLADSLTDLVEKWRGLAPRLLRRKLNTRSVAWSLQFASVACRLGAENECHKILEGLFAKIVEAPGASVPLFDSIPKADDLYQVAPWVAVGILGEALMASPNVPKRNAAVARFCDSAELILKASWKGPKQGLAKTLTMNVVEDSPVFVGGRATGEEALFFALGLVRAVQLSGGGNRALLKQAKAICIWALDHLTIHKGMFSGMRLSQLLWVYPRLFGSN